MLITSLPCQWKPPKKRKESTMQMSEATFTKHAYDKKEKRKSKLLEDFDPRPLEFRGTAADHLPALLQKIRGENLCVSLLFDKKYHYWDSSALCSPDPELPNVTALKSTVDAFKASLAVTDDDIHRIERETVGQRKSSHWFDFRRYRITASIFGTILRRKSDIPPDSLVLRILQPKNFTSAATEWGIQRELAVIEEYVRHQQSHGHSNLSVAACGFYISKSHPYLGASPDGAIYDPSTPAAPFGFLEIKCPYAHRNVTPMEASLTSGFCSRQVSTDGTTQLCLRETHPYFAQVQGQMAIGCRPWSDFVLYTLKGISIQRISFNKDYWEKNIAAKPSRLL